ncbi:MAG: sigma-70 family RNA polymerase sigma factor [Polyangiaceae bacterium]
MPASNPTDELTKAHLDLVPLICRQVMRELGVPAHVRDELESAGRAGLVEAAQRFDSSRGVPFRRYANHRIRGAVLDTIRKEIPLKRRLLEKVKVAEAALALNETLSESLTATTGPTSSSSADELLASHLENLATAAALGLASQSDEVDDLLSEPISPEDALCRAQTRAEVSRVLDTLGEPEKSVVRRHHLDGERLDLIALDMGMSRSWICRIHTRGVEQLSKRLRHLR